MTIDFAELNFVADSLGNIDPAPIGDASINTTNTTDLINFCLDAIGDSDAEFQVVYSFLHWNGSNNSAISNRHQAEIWTYGDGYGKMGIDELYSRELVFDWSHIRDSSPMAINRILGAIIRALSGRRVYKG